MPKATRSSVPWSLEAYEKKGRFIKTIGLNQLLIKTEFDRLPPAVAAIPYLINMEKRNDHRQDLSSGSSGSSYKEKRYGADRRTNNTARLKYLLFNGRRERVRRDEDRQKTFFFDRYNPKLFMAITLILVLSILDALLTLIVIEKGATELNPVMAHFLEYGPLVFVVAKYVLTSVGVLILLIFKNVFLSKIKIYTHSLFPCVIIVFAAVIAWELFLLYSAP